MNFFGTEAYLSVLQEVYFSGHETHVIDTEVGGRVFRLLWVDGRPITEWSFLDYHEPIPASAEAHWGFLARVSHGLYDQASYHARFSPAWSDSPRLTIEGRPFLPAPCTRWSGFSSFDDYAALLRERSPKRSRQDMQLRRKLEREQGELRFSPNDEADDVLPFSLELKSKQSLETKGVDFFDDQKDREFFHVLRERGLLRASTLRASGRLVASALGVVSARRSSGWILSYQRTDRYRKYSLGRQLLYYVLEQSYREGHEEFDFSVGDKEHKWYFATHARPCGPIGRLSGMERLKAMLRPHFGPTYRRLKTILPGEQ